MKCHECPVSLVCYAGQLDSEAAVTLCVKCGRLEFMPPKEDRRELLQLFCEQRQLTKEMTAAYYTKLRPQLDMQALISENGNIHVDRVFSHSQPHIIAEVPWPDTGPGLIKNEFRLRVCYRCEPLAERYAPINICDMDKLCDVEQEVKPHVFELAGSRRSKP
jgi:hypothetical protein